MQTINWYQPKSKDISKNDKNNEIILHRKSLKKCSNNSYFEYLRKSIPCQEKEIACSNNVQIMLQEINSTIGYTLSSISNIINLWIGKLQ